MPRIPAVAPTDAPLIVRLVYRLARRRLGEVPEPFAVLAHHRRLFVTALRHELAAEKASTSLPAAVRELAVYRVARTIGCSWCVDFGAMLQRMDGLNIDRLAQIDEYATSPLFSDDERAALSYADGITAPRTSVATSTTDEQVADLEQRFGRAGLIELTYQIGLENMRARMYAALGIVDQGFSSGDACRVPWAANDPGQRESVEESPAGERP